MHYEKHNLAVQRYLADEFDHVILPDRCEWKVYNHLGKGRFENILDSGGDPCLILEDRELGHWSIMSFLQPDEIALLAEQLRAAAEGSTDPLEEEEINRRYEKHNIAFRVYTPVEPGRVTPPDHCRWVVRKHQGGGKFNSRSEAPGRLCLILEDNPNDFLPVMSFLTPDEAITLAGRLEKAVESARKHRPVDPEALLDTAAAAEILGVTPRQVTRLIRSGQLEASQFNTVYILTREEVERYNRERKPRGRPPASALKDEMTLMFDDDAGEGWKLPFSIVRRVVPEECGRFETAVEKLASAVETMDLDGMEGASREFLARRERLVEALHGAVVRIPGYLEDVG